MYLHCEVLVCANNEENSTRCAEGCVQDNSGGSRRKRRDDTNQERKEVTSLGPLKILLDRLLVQGPNEGKSNLLDNYSSSILFWRILNPQSTFSWLRKRIDLFRSGGWFRNCNQGSGVLYWTPKRRFLTDHGKLNKHRTLLILSSGSLRLG